MTSTPSASPTPKTLAEWRDKYSTDIVLVIGTANNLLRASDQADETKIKIACNALKNNYSSYLQPIPFPSAQDYQDAWETGKIQTYNAQRDCRNGLIRKLDLYKARTEASDGVAALHKVVGPAS